jgi:hypothetical protein
MEVRGNVEPIVDIIRLDRGRLVLLLLLLLLGLVVMTVALPSVAKDDDEDDGGGMLMRGISERHSRTGPVASGRATVASVAY